MAYEAGASGNAGQYVLDFMKSPGFGALAVVIGACVAVVGVLQQLKVAKADKRSDEWWRLFEWAAGTASDPRPSGVTQATITALVPLATGTAERLACKALMEHALPVQGLGAQASSDDQISALRHYVEVSRGTSAASAEAELRVLLEDFMDTFRLVAPTIDVRMLGQRGTADLELDVGGRLVGVVFAARSTPVLRHHIQQAVRRSEGGFSAWIVVYRHATKTELNRTESLSENVVACELPTGIDMVDAESTITQALRSVF